MAIPTCDVDRRWRARLLGSAALCLARDAGAAGLGASHRERARQAAEAPAAEGEGGPSRDHEGGVARRGAGGDRELPGGVRRQVSEGARVAQPGPGQAAHVLRLPRRALGPRPHEQPDRVGLLDGAVAERVTKGAGSRRRGLTMAFKLLETAQQRWRRLNASELLPLVRAGIPFKDGVRVERDDQTTENQPAEIAA